MFDTFGRKINYLRLSVTDKCNLRCRYCMPEEGVRKRSHGDMLSEDEMIMAVETAASLGISKLRITGGEPLVKKNILSICSRAAAVEGIEEVCITTNGILLPQMAAQLRSAGVSRVNISLDTLNADKYAYITRRDSFAEAMAGIEAAVKGGFEKIKVNTVLIGLFNDDEIEALAELTMKYPIDVRFIELMPMYDGGEFGESAMIKGDAVLRRLPELVPVDSDGGVAKLYRMPGAKGSIGLISPVSSHFCADCNRIRLTADGKLKPCLHSGVEYSIKGLNREGMAEQFKNAVMAKPACRDELSTQKRSGAGRNMNAIGG